MLTKMHLTNFLSFSKKTEFDFTASKYNILSERNVSNKNILKGALFIGPNASGKSNVLRGIGLIIRLIKDTGSSIANYCCYFAENSTTEIEYEFNFDDNIVNYKISYNLLEKKLSETLSIDDKNVLMRNGNRGEIILGENSITDDNLENDTLFLRTASFNTGKFPNEPTLNKLMNYLFNSYYISGYTLAASLGKNLAKYADEFGVDKLNDYLKVFNYDFFLEYGTESSGEGLSIRVSSGEKSVFFKRNSFPMPSVFTRESQGNQVFADMLPRLISVIEQPGMLIIDEFGNSIHNRLAEKIVNFFMEKSAYSQLFIASHDTNLISNSVFRPDQINLISFEKGSSVKRLSIFKPREAQNLEKMYLGGMFEGLPKYDE